MSLILPTIAGDLDQHVRQYVPAIAGVSVGRRDDRSTWKVTWPPGYSPSGGELAAVETAMASFVDEGEPE